jgi:hypothetical protein
MPFVITHPEALTAAARGVGSVLTTRNVATATTGFGPAAADEVSVLTATQFSAHTASTGSSAATEAATTHRNQLTDEVNDDRHIRFRDASARGRRRITSAVAPAAQG